MEGFGLGSGLFQIVFLKVPFAQSAPVCRMNWFGGWTGLQSECGTRQDAREEMGTDTWPEWSVAMTACIEADTVVMGSR